MDNFEIKEYLENLKENSHYEKNPFRFQTGKKAKELEREEQARQDAEYAQGSGLYGNGDEPLYLGDIEYYENPKVKTVVDLMKSSKRVAYLVSDKGTVVVSGDRDFLEPSVRLLFNRYYQTSPERCGYISMMPRGTIFPGLDGNLVITKSQFRKQIKSVEDSLNILTKKIPILKISPQTKKFLSWVDLSFDKLKAPAQEFQFATWIKKGYNQEEYQGDIDLTDAKVVARFIEKAYKENKITAQQKDKAERLLSIAKTNRDDKTIAKVKSIILSAIRNN